MRAWWSNDRASRGGLAVFIHESFLRRFGATAREDWDELCPGRLAVLHLHGPEGDLDICCTYMPTGHHRAERAPLVDQIAR